MATQQAAWLGRRRTLSACERRPVGSPRHDITRRKRYFYGKTKREAQAKVRQSEREADMGLANLDARQTVRAFLDHGWRKCQANASQAHV